MPSKWVRTALKAQLTHFSKTSRFQSYTLEAKESTQLNIYNSFPRRPIMKRTLTADDAPVTSTQKDGVYSQGVTNGVLVFTAGQVPLEPNGNLLNEEPIGVQTTQCLENVRAVVKEAGATMEDVLKVTVFLEDIDTFDEMNDAYIEFFPTNPPARSAVEVSRLPKDIGVEIEAIAQLQK